VNADFETVAMATLCYRRMAAKGVYRPADVEHGFARRLIRITGADEDAALERARALLPADLDLVAQEGDGWVDGYCDCRDTDRHRSLAGKSEQYKADYDRGWNDRLDDENRFDLEFNAHVRDPEEEPEGVWL
jgi:hypothetical protein